MGTIITMRWTVYLWWAIIKFFHPLCAPKKILEPHLCTSQNILIPPLSSRNQLWKIFNKLRWRRKKNSGPLFDSRKILAPLEYPTNIIDRSKGEESFLWAFNQKAARFFLKPLLGAWFFEGGKEDQKLQSWVATIFSPQQKEGQIFLGMLKGAKKIDDCQSQTDAPCP